MNVQLIYQGQAIDVAIPDQNTTCQYLYDFALNGFQCAVQIIYALPNGDTGLVDPSWSVLQLVQAGVQFQVNLAQGGNPIEDGGEEIPIYIYVNDQYVTQLNANVQQTLKEVDYSFMSQLIDFVNQNMSTQYQQCQVYVSLGQGLSNNSFDYLSQFDSQPQPFLLFIPRCQSGIQKFVQAGEQSQLNAAQGGNSNQTGNVDIPINIYVNDQLVTSINANKQETLQYLIDYVNQNCLKQYQQCEIYDSLGQGLSNNLFDYLYQFGSQPQPFLLFIPRCASGIQKFVKHTEN